MTLELIWMPTVRFGHYFIFLHEDDNVLQSYLISRSPHVARVKLGFIS